MASYWQERTGELCALALGDFPSSYALCKGFLLSYALFLTVYKSCLILVACLNVSEYLPFLIPSGVLCFRKIIGQDKKQASGPQV